MRRHERTIVVMHTETDRNGLEILSRAESLALLASVPVARVALSIEALPVVLPVNIVCVDDLIMMRTAAGTKLDAALENAVVAIEADTFDLLDHSGWSVLVRGTSHVLQSPAELEQARRLALRSWASDAADRYVAISTELVSGRRLTRVGADRATMSG